MKAVIRQEFKLHIRRILWGCVFLFILNIGTIIVNEISLTTQNTGISIASSMMMTSVFFVDTLGICLWSLFRGAGNISSMLFRDSAYLMKSLPKSSFVLITGKMIVGLFEFVLYLIQVGIYFILQTSQLFVTSSNDVFTIIPKTGAIEVLEKNFFMRILFTIQEIFGNYFSELVNVIGIIIMLFIFAQVILNCAMTIYSCVGQSRRFSKLLMAIIIFVLFWISSRITGEFLDFANFRLKENIAVLWIPIGILAIPNAVYYGITAFLYEKKISL